MSVRAPAFSSFLERGERRSREDETRRDETVAVLFVVVGKQGKYSHTSFTPFASVPSVPFPLATGMAIVDGDM
jgi:hypothetical protein